MNGLEVKNSHGCYSSTLRFTRLVCLFVLFSSLVSAQKGSITGVISDKATSDIIPFARVEAFLTYNPASLKSTLSDSKGVFILDNLPLGEYSLLVSFMGYQTDTLQLSIDKQHQQVNSGKIELRVLAVALNEVQVNESASTVTTHVDRVTYNIQDYQTAKGGDASDVLSKLPSVSIDQDGIISVRGTSDFLVYVNGKPSQLESASLLTQIKAANIESIDIITVPSAKYEAQGKGGIVNISTKRTQEKGLSVSANGLLGGAPWADYMHLISDYRINDNRLGGGLNFIYTENKLSIYGGFTYNEKRINGTRGGAAGLLQDNGSYFHMVPKGPRVEWTQNSTANVATEYRLNDQSTLSASYYYGNNSKGRLALFNYHTFYGDENKNPQSGIPVEDKWTYNPNEKVRKGVFHAANVDFSRMLTATSELKVSALVEHSLLKNEIENRQYALNPTTERVGTIEQHYKQTDQTPLNGLLLSIDYTRKLKNGHVLSIGVRPQYVSMNGSFSFDTLNVSNNQWGDYHYFENAVDFSRGIYAGYVDYSGIVGKVNYVTGLRLEYTDQELNIDNPDYFTIFDRIKKPKYETHKLDWFPTLQLSYAVSEKEKVNAALSRRISRPQLTSMTPFLYREHLEVYVVGDPALEPEYQTAFDLSFQRKYNKSDIRLVGFYRETTNAVFRVNTVYIPENTLIRSYTNSATTQSTGMEVNLNGTTGNFARYVVTGSLYHFRVQADVFGYQENNSSVNWTVKGNATFNLTSSLKFTTDVDVKSATITAQGKDDLFYMANASLNFTPKKLKGWDFSLKVLDILSSNLTTVSTRAYATNGDKLFLQKSIYDLNGPVLELNVAYAFNMKGKSSKKVESTLGKEQF